MENVIRKKLNDLIETITPPQKLKKDSYLTLGKYPIIDQGKNYLAGYTNDEKVLLPYGEYVLFGDHTLSVKYINGRFAQGADGLKILKSKENNTKYLYYALCEYNLRNTEYKRHWTQAKEIEIPLPPLAIQKKIVEILDTFTGMIDNLQKELKQRQKQFEYYKEKWLTFEEGKATVMKVGDLFDFKNGLNKEKSAFGQGTSIVNYTDVYKHRGLKKIDLAGLVTLSDKEIERYRCLKGDVFFTRTSETKEEVGFPSVLLEDIENCTFSGFVLRARPKTSKLLPEYCKYCFFTYSFRKEVIKSATLTTRALTNGGSLSKIKISIPSLEKQQEIVDKLDTFEALISNIKQEIELRQKQYEYYREKLLTFE